MLAHMIEGGGGLRLHVREGGKPDGVPILFLHGWSQHHLCWGRQFEGPLVDEFRLVAMDLRGHGQSEAPLEAGHYTNGALWADDVRAVIEALGLDRPVLVGWSYGGFIIGDYLRKYGDAGIAGVNFVAAAIGLGEAWAGTHIGPTFLHYAPLTCSEDQAVALGAMRDFLLAAIRKPIATEDALLAMGWAMLVRPEVRAHLISRTMDFTPELARMTVPALVTYGAADTAVMPAMARVIGASVKVCEMSEYAEVGHAPFIEEPDRFNAELADFARRASGRI